MCITIILIISLRQKRLIHWIKTSTLKSQDPILATTTAFSTVSPTPTSDWGGRHKVMAFFSSTPAAYFSSFSPRNEISLPSSPFKPLKLPSYWPWEKVYP